MKNNFNFNDFYAKILRLNNNSITILSKLAESFTIFDSSVEYIELGLVDENGNNQTYRIPAYSFLKNRMVEIEKNVKLLQGAKNQQIQETTELSDQNYFIEPDIPGNLKLLSSAKAIDNTWLKNLTNIDLFYTLDLTNIINPTTKQIEILKINIDEDKNSSNLMNYIDNDLVGRNDLNLTLVKSTLKSRGIIFSEEKSIHTLTPIELQSSGKFLIYNIPYSIIETGVTNYQLKLDTIFYNRNGSSVILSKGDVLVNSKTKTDFYVVDIVDSASNSMTIQKLGGSVVPLQGDVLKIASELGKNRSVDIKCSPFSRQLIFMRQLTPNLGITSLEYGNGIGVKPNSLSILDSVDGKTKTLYEYYIERVYDYGEFFSGLESEMKISAIYGIIPETPILKNENFKVVLINDHLNNVSNISDDAQKLISDLDFYISKRNNLNGLKVINEEKLQLLTKDKSSNNTEILNITATITSINEELETTLSSISSTNVKLAAMNININMDTYNPKYRVRGFWNFPTPKRDKKGRLQDVIRFDIQYRYLSLVEVPTCNTIINFTDITGDVRDAIFSDWNETSTKVRDKVWNEMAGRYLWDYENITDTIPNVNQLDIPISPYEKVEIRIRSISEAGYPENPIKSDWSQSIIMEFPSEYYSIKSDSQTTAETVANSNANFAIDSQFEAMNNKIKLLEAKLNEKVSSVMNFKYITISESIRNSGILSINEASLQNIQNKYILINLEQGLILNPSVDYEIKVSENVFKLQESYLNALKINDKLLLIYTN